jgi:hypothetical protein
VDKYEQKWLIVTGISLLLMAIFASFSFVYVHSEIYVVGKPEVTMEHLRSKSELFKYGLLSWILVFALDLIVSVGIYKIYKKSNAKIAFISSVLRGLYTAILGIAVAFLSMPLFTDVSIVNVLMPFQKFDSIWNIGLILFGLHLVSLSLITFLSKFTPRIIIVLLLIGGLSYVFVHTLKSFSLINDEFAVNAESILAAPMALSELLFALWLLYKYFSYSECKRRKLSFFEMGKYRKN